MNSQDCTRCGGVVEDDKQVYVLAGDFEDDIEISLTVGVYVDGGDMLRDDVKVDLTEFVENEIGDISSEIVKDFQRSNLIGIVSGLEQSPDGVLSGEGSIIAKPHKDKSNLKETLREDYELVGTFPSSDTERVQRTGVICRDCYKESDEVIWSKEDDIS